MDEKYCKSCDKRISYSNWAHHLKSKKQQEQLKTLLIATANQKKNNQTNLKLLTINRFDT